jgi:hypothetical protein
MGCDSGEIGNILENSAHLTGKFLFLIIKYQTPGPPKKPKQNNNESSSTSQFSILFSFIQQILSKLLLCDWYCQVMENVAKHWSLLSLSSETLPVIGAWHWVGEEGA